MATTEAVPACSSRVVTTIFTLLPMAPGWQAFSTATGTFTSFSTCGNRDAGTLSAPRTGISKMRLPLGGYFRQVLLAEMNCGEFGPEMPKTLL